MQDLTYQLRRQAERAIRAENAVNYWKGLAEKRGRIAGLTMLAVLFLFFAVFIFWCFGLVSFGVSA